MPLPMLVDVEAITWCPPICHTPFGPVDGRLCTVPMNLVPSSFSPLPESFDPPPLEPLPFPPPAPVPPLP